MKRMHCLLLTLLFALPASAQDAAASGLSDNAALRYWMAFSFLPENGDDEYETLNQWEHVAVDVAREQFFGPIDSGMQVLDHFAWAVEADHCVWAVQREVGPYALLPHLSPGRVLARMALLRARIRLHDGDAAGAADDLLLVFELGRDFDSDRLLISSLVGMSIESMAVEFTAQHLSAIDDAAVRRLVAGIEGLDARPALSAVIRGERDTFIGWLEATLHQAEDDGAEESTLHALAPELGLANDAGGMVTRTIDQWQAWTDDTKLAYDEAGRVADLPCAEFREAIGELEAGYADTDNIVIKMFMPSVGAVRASCDRAAARLAMLRAMLAIRLDDGGTELADHPAMQDPFGDGTFELIVERNDDGAMVYGLRSALTDRDGRPVELHTDAPLVGE